MLFKSGAASDRRGFVFLWTGGAVKPDLIIRRGDVFERE